MPTRAGPAVLVLVVVLTAGCVAPVGAGDRAGGVQVTGTDDGRLGVEDGVAADDDIDVDPGDGLDGAELEAMLDRGMARVEAIRGHEFTRPIAVEVVTREALRERVNRTGSFTGEDALSADRRRVMNAFWEALFFVGEDRDAAAVRAGETSAFLGAYYEFGSDTITVVTDDPDRLPLGERLLIHELVHALQDEYAHTPLRTRSDDDSYAASALIEGDAMVVQYRYRERCASGEWDCIEAPPAGTGAGPAASGDVHRGFRTLRRFAYSDGAAFVGRVHDEGRFGATGWGAVDTAYAIRPRSTEEVIHPERYPAADPRRPRAVAVEPTGGWTVLGGPYTVGELEVFGLFWYAREAHGIAAIPDTFDEPDGGRYDRFNYTSRPSEGWDGDWLTVVERDGRTGYVWLTQWDSPADAREFAAAYRAVLEGHGARALDGRTWLIEAGPYADAFTVVVDGRRVSVVNGPTPAALEAIHPPLAG